MMRGNHPSGDRAAHPPLVTLPEGNVCGRGEQTMTPKPPFHFSLCFFVTELVLVELETPIHDEATKGHSLLSHAVVTVKKEKSL